MLIIEEKWTLHFDRVQVYISNRFCFRICYLWSNGKNDHSVWNQRKSNWTMDSGTCSLCQIGIQCYKPVCFSQWRNQQHLSDCMLCLHNQCIFHVRPASSSICYDACIIEVRSYVLQNDRWNGRIYKNKCFTN